MPKVAMLFGILLIGLGFAGYYGAPVEHRSATAFIPAIAGFLLMDCGLLALRPDLRKHAMHAAAVVALLGFISPWGRLIPKMIQGAAPKGLALWSMLGMSALCLVFEILCVRSFIAARKARQGFTVEPAN